MGRRTDFRKRDGGMCGSLTRWFTAFMKRACNSAVQTRRGRLCRPSALLESPLPPSPAQLCSFLHTESTIIPRGAISHADIIAAPLSFPGVAAASFTRACPLMAENTWKQHDPEKTLSNIVTSLVRLRVLSNWVVWP